MLEPPAVQRQGSLLSSAPEESGERLLEISNAIVRLYKERFGRGPVGARASFAGSDALLVVLDRSLTVFERNLVALGERIRLQELRALVHAGIEPELRAVVERVLRRKVLACVSGIDPAQDVSIELFTLEPARGQVPRERSAAALGGNPRAQPT